MAQVQSPTSMKWPHADYHAANRVQRMYSLWIYNDHSLTITPNLKPNLTPKTLCLTLTPCLNSFMVMHPKPFHNPFTVKHHLPHVPTVNLTNADSVLNTHGYKH